MRTKSSIGNTQEIELRTCSTRKHTLDVTVGLNGPVVTYSNIKVFDLMLTNVNSPNATMLTDTITADIVRNNLEFLNDFFLSV